MRARHLVMLVCLGGLFCAQALGAEFELRGEQWSTAPAAAPGTPAGDLAVIRQHVEQGRYRAAASAAKKFFKVHESDPLREEAAMLAGEAQMRRGYYYQAYEWYEKQLAEAPGGSFAERALVREFEIAEAFLNGKKRIVAGILRLPATDEGLEILSRVAGHAPGTVLAERALLRIGDYHFAHKEFPEAAEAYDNYLELFPHSARHYEVSLQAALATYYSYQGVAYDETPLIDAQDRFSLLKESYPARAAEAGVDEILTSIREQRAAVLYETVKFHNRTGRPEAAAYYGALLERDFAGTAVAQSAITSIKAVQGAR